MGSNFQIEDFFSANGSSKQIKTLLTYLIFFSFVNAMNVEGWCYEIGVLSLFQWGFREYFRGDDLISPLIVILLPY